QRAHFQEARPDMPEAVDDHRHPRTAAGNKILIENEERLHRLYFAVGVPYGEVSIVESLADRIFDQLVVARMLAFAGKRMLPAAATHKIRPRENLDGPNPAHVLLRNTRWCIHGRRGR